MWVAASAQVADREIEIQAEDRVHHGDVIDVDVVGGFEFDWRGTLTPEGYLDGADGFSEPIYALCRKESDIAVDVARVYSKLLRDPKIVVRIIDRTNRPVVRVEGAVRTPTRFRLQRPVFLREILVLAGGLTDSASGEIVVFRQKNLSCPTTVPVPREGEVAAESTQDNGSQTTRIKISEILKGSGDVDPQVFSGDIITVTRTAPFYVIGAVNNPRPIYSHLPMTVSRAIASAGGPAKDADENKVSIFRRKGIDTRIIEVDLGKIKTGEAEDVLLTQFDIIEVTSKSGGTRKYPPVVVQDENADNERLEQPLRVID